MKITEKTFDVITGQETITERQETVAEKDLRLKYEANLLAEKQANESLAAAKQTAQAKLAALGLTSDDLKALGL
jgi:hypothetical protein